MTKNDVSSEILGVKIDIGKNLIQNALIRYSDIAVLQLWSKSCKPSSSEKFEINQILMDDGFICCFYPLILCDRYIQPNIFYFYQHHVITEKWQYVFTSHTSPPSPSWNLTDIKYIYLDKKKPTRDVIKTFQESVQMCWPSARGGLLKRLSDTS